MSEASLAFIPYPYAYPETNLHVRQLTTRHLQAAFSFLDIPTVHEDKYKVVVSFKGTETKVLQVGICFYGCSNSVLEWL
jgi:hypothetical protein